MASVHPLKPGDTIGIAASASPFDRELFAKGIEVLYQLGFRTYHREDIFTEDRYLAGSDERRAQELTELFEKPDIKAILFARGGYGSQRIIPLLDAKTIRKHRKPVVGVSDITALLVWLRQACEVPTFYGPVVTQLGRAHYPLTREHLKHALTTPEPLGTLPHESSVILKPGEATGTLVGGCLSLITSSIGTDDELDTKGAILFLEDIDEKAYAIDRMLTQLTQAGKFKKVKGLVFGSLIPREGEVHDLKKTLRDVLADFSGPIVVDYPAGHVEGFVTLPLGVKTTLSAIVGAPPQLTIRTSLFR